MAQYTIVIDFGTESGRAVLVDKLEANGLLNRPSAVTDGRGAFTVLTDEGMAALRKARPVYARGIRTYFADSLSDDEVRVYRDSLARMLQAMEQE